MDPPVIESSDDTNSQPVVQHNKRSLNHTGNGFVTQSTELDSLFEGSSKRPKHTEEPTPTASTYQLNGKTLTELHCQPVYNASKCLPKLGLYHPSFKLAEKAIDEACSSFINAADDAQSHGNEELQVVRQTLASLQKLSSLYPPVRPVAILGPAGSGKSSALNSLMKQQRVAFAHDGQSRGTYVVHEYRHAHHQQTSRYHVVVPFISKYEMQKAVRKQYSAIRSHLIYESDKDNEIADDERPLDAYETAIGFFCDLFADIDEFQTWDDTIEFFSNMDYDSDKKNEDMLLKHLDDFIGSRTQMVNDEETYATDTESDLDGIIRAVARPVNNRNQGRKPCPWPVIRKVVIHQKIGLLEGGVVLADLPGVNDSNQIVAANTRSYLKQAGIILIFLHYQRVSKNSCLDQLLRECITRGKTHETRVVLTKIDEMKPFDESAIAELHETDRQLVRKAEDLVAELESKVADTAIAKEHCDHFQYRELDLKLREYEQQLKEAKAGVKQAAVDIQCRDMVNELKDRFRTLRRSQHEPDLPIDFISNTTYQQLVAGSKAKNTPDLGLLERTGIPDLEQQVLKIPALGKLDKLYALCNIRMRGLFSGIDGILTKSVLERKAEVKAALVQQLNQAYVPIDATVEEIKSAYKEEIAKRITKSEPEWRKRAELVLAEWNSLRAGTFLALCKRKGDWDHRKLKKVFNCNLDIQMVLETDLLHAFDEFKDRFNGIREDIRKNIHDLFENIRRAVENCPAAAGQRLDSFMEYIDQVRQSTVLAIDNLFADLEQGIDSIRNSATVDAEDSYVRRIMYPVYLNCELINSHNVQTFNRAANDVEDTKPTLLNSGFADTKNTLIAADVNDTNSTPSSTVGEEKKNVLLPNGAGDTKPLLSATKKMRGRGKKLCSRRSTHATVRSARIQNIRNKICGENQISLGKEMTKMIFDDLGVILDELSEGARKIVEQSRMEIIEDFDRRFQAPEVKAEEDPEVTQKLLDAAAVSKGELEKAQGYLHECFAYEGREAPY